MLQIFESFGFNHRVNAWRQYQKLLLQSLEWIANRRLRFFYQRLSQYLMTRYSNPSGVVYKTHIRSSTNLNSSDSITVNYINQSRRDWMLIQKKQTKSWEADPKRVECTRNRFILHGTKSQAWRTEQVTLIKTKTLTVWSGFYWFRFLFLNHLFSNHLRVRAANRETFSGLHLNNHTAIEVFFQFPSNSWC